MSDSYIYWREIIHTTKGGYFSTPYIIKYVEYSNSIARACFIADELYLEFL